MRQLMVLSKAAARDDGVGRRSAENEQGGGGEGRIEPGGAQSHARNPLKARNADLARSENGKSVSLIITRAGRDAIGIEEMRRSLIAPIATKTCDAAAP